MAIMAPLAALAGLFAICSLLLALDGRSSCRGSLGLTTRGWIALLWAAWLLAVAVSWVLSYERAG